MAQGHIQNEQIVLKKRLSELTEEKKDLENALLKIQRAKAFRLWQKIDFVKDNLHILMNTSFLSTLLFKKNPFASSYMYTSEEKKFLKPVEIPPSATEYDNVSIVVPTYNGEQDLPLLLQGISSQKGLRNPELLIIDSGSTDKTLEIAKKYGARIIPIPQKEFNHGLTRNQAAKKAKGKYIIFTVQDALPLHQETCKRLLNLLTSQPSIAAVSTRQLPFPDADIFAKWQIRNHVHALHLEGEQYISTIPQNNNLFSYPFYIKRKVTLLDDVCCAVNKDIFTEVGGYKKVDFAEDVDFAIRALEKGFKIGFVGTTGVVHSHNRPADYFLRRYYADVMSVHTLLKEKIPSVFADTNDMILSVHGLLHDVSEQYPEINTTAIYALIKAIAPRSIPKTEFTYNDRLNKNYYALLNESKRLFTKEELEQEPPAQFVEKLLGGFIGIYIALHVLDLSSPPEREHITSVILKNV